MDLLRDARRLYERGEIHDALQAAQAACDRRPADTEAWALLARVARHAGLPAASDLAFEKAAALDPAQRLPHRLTREAFTRLVVDSAPPEAHVHVEDLPSPDAIQAGVSPDAVSRHEPASAVVLYQVNFENRSGSEEELQALVAETLTRA